MQKVLITGSSGFTASHLIPHLKQSNFKIFQTSTSAQIKKDCFNITNFSKEALSKVLSKVRPDYIIHLAAISYTTPQDSSDIFQVNSYAVKNLLDTIQDLKLNPQKVILSSSGNIYGSSNMLLNEEAELNGVNDYSKSKILMEEIAQQYFNNINIIITRPFNYSGYGHNKRFILPKIASHFIEKRKLIELGDINIIRDFSYINDVVNSYRKLMLCPAKSEIVNICSSKGQSIKDLINIFELVTGRKIIVNSTETFRRNNDIHRQVGCNKKLKKLINFAPSPFSIDHASHYLKLLNTNYG